MTVERVDFERLEDAPPAFERWQVRVLLRGSGFEHRSAPIVVAVGELNVELIVPLITDEGIAGIQGLLTEVPPNGAEVSVGYADGPLFGTGFEFSASQL